MGGWVEMWCAYQHSVLQSRCCLDSTTPVVVCTLVCVIQWKDDLCKLARNLPPQQLNRPRVHLLHIHGGDECAGPPGQYVWQLSCEQRYLGLPTVSLKAQQQEGNVGICIYNAGYEPKPFPAWYTGVYFLVEARISCTNWGGGAVMPSLQGKEVQIDDIPL